MAFSVASGPLMWGGSLEESLAGATRACLQVTSDAAATNHLVIKHLSTRLPPNAYLLFQRCLQHQAALSLSFATVEMGFLTKLFSTAKVWQDGGHLRRLRLAVKQVLAKNVERDVLTPPQSCAAATDGDLAPALFLHHCSRRLFH